ncbi:MAG TPA: hypothetical protein VGR35_22740 [Tepidisphaeraceae bacterium]|nr:hypothetical protein [Tepidisphaeraceae bacterium]
MTQAISTPAGYKDPFGYDRYIVRRKIFKLLGAAFHVYDEAGNLVMYSKQKAFKLKEDIRLYSDESMKVELLTITARSVLDFSAAYDVIDPLARQKVGALRRKGWSSIARDSWMLLNERDQEIGTIQEDSMLAALVRRFIDAASLFMPQKFHAEMNGQTVCTYQQNFNPLVRKLTIDFTHDRNHQLDKRLGLAAAVLLSAIEGKQN